MSRWAHEVRSVSEPHGKTTNFLALRCPLTNVSGPVTNEEILGVREGDAKSGSVAVLELRDSFSVFVPEAGGGVVAAREKVPSTAVGDT